MRTYLLAAASAAVLSFASPAFASLLVPPTASDCCTPDNLLLNSSSVLLNSIIDQPFASTLNTATHNDFSGVYSEWAYSNPDNAFGAGDVTLIIQVTSDAGSTESIDRVTASDFTGLSTDAGIITGSGGVLPLSVDRTSEGPVGFNGSLGAGFTTAFYQIDTNGLSVVPGNVSMINDGTSTNPGFSAAIPETRTWAMALIGFAMLGLIGLRKRSARFAV
jgi:hypothetical protein